MLKNASKILFLRFVFWRNPNMIRVPSIEHELFEIITTNVLHFLLATQFSLKVFFTLITVFKQISSQWKRVFKSLESFNYSHHGTHTRHIMIYIYCRKPKIFCRSMTLFWKTSVIIFNNFVWLIVCYGDNLYSIVKGRTIKKFNELLFHSFFILIKTFNVDRIQIRVVFQLRYGSYRSVCSKSGFEFS